jgi:hypothetical protein
VKEKIIAYLKSAFSEVDGTGSASRLLALLSILANMVWVTYLVIRNHVMPDLTGSAMYVGASFTGYAANKVSDAFKGRQHEDSDRHS